MTPSRDDLIGELKYVNRRLKRQGMKPMLKVKEARSPDVDTRTIRAAIADGNHRLYQLGGLDR
jgi:hypothetical protein